MKSAKSVKNYLSAVSLYHNLLGLPANNLDNFQYQTMRGALSLTMRHSPLQRIFTGFLRVSQTEQLGPTLPQRFQRQSPHHARWHTDPGSRPGRLTQVDQNTPSHANTHSHTHPNDSRPCPRPRRGLPGYGCTSANLAPQWSPTPRSRLDHTAVTNLSARYIVWAGLQRRPLFSAQPAARRGDIQCQSRGELSTHHTAWYMAFNRVLDIYCKPYRHWLTCCLSTKPRNIANVVKLSAVLYSIHNFTLQAWDLIITYPFGSQFSITLVMSFHARHEHISTSARLFPISAFLPTSYTLSLLWRFLHYFGE